MLHTLISRDLHPEQGEVGVVITILQIKLKESKPLALVIKVTVTELAPKSTLPPSSVTQMTLSSW